MWRAKKRRKHKGDKEPSPTDHVTRLESQKGERLDPCKSESLDRDGKGKAKKPLKSDSGSDGKDSLVDSFKLEARKRRFGDPGGKRYDRNGGVWTRIIQVLGLANLLTWLQVQDLQKKQILMSKQRKRLKKENTPIQD